MQKIIMLLVLLLFPSAVFANAGLPMLAIVWPLSLPAFLPVVLIESYVMKKEFSIGYSRSLVLITKANILSTLVGIPFAWFACLFVEFLIAIFFIAVIGTEGFPPSNIPGIPESFENIAMVVLTFPWLGSWGKEASWVVPFATSLMLLPCFYVSYWSEYFFIKRSFKNENKVKLLAVVKKANLYTYALLLLSCFIWLLTSVI